MSKEAIRKHLKQHNEEISAMNHTPYEIEEVISVSIFGEKSENYAIVQKDSRDRVALLGPNKKANAEFIVTACNAHEDLVKALKYYADTDSNTYDDGQMAREALAKAGVKP